MLLALAALPVGWIDALAYQRAGIAGGQWWRLISAHFVHLNLTHAAMNAAALALVWLVLHRAATAAGWLLLGLLLGVSLALALWWLAPELQRYVGASGVLHGLVAFGALRLLKRQRIECVLLLVGLIVKLAWEQRFGASAQTAAWIGGRVIVDAHAYGALAGALLAGADFVWRRGRRRA